MNYRAEIDGLRALAVAPVILFHAGFELFSGGFVGVDVFFVISGYLITSLLIQDIENKRFSLIHFYERRARRILPALYCVVLVSLAASTLILLPQELLSAAKSALSITFFSSNFFFWSERGYFGAATELKPLIHTWSLAVEEQFYIVFPIGLLLISKLKRLTFISLLLLALLVSLSASYYVTRLHFDTAFYFPFTRAWELLIGTSCALILRSRSGHLNTRLSESICIFGLMLISVSFLAFDKNTLFPYIWALVPTVGTALFILTAGNTKYLKRLFGWKPIVGIGVISYSLYLWHQPIFALARASEIFESNEMYFIAASSLLAYLSYRFVERPFRNRAKVSSKVIWLASLVTTVVIIIASLLIISSKGLPNRFHADDQKLLIQLATYSSYAPTRFEELELEPFDNNSEKKIMLIGDSHAMDFLNVFVESNLFTNYSFSTRHINFECGNLLLEDYESVQEFIPASRRDRCVVLGRYESEAFTALIEESDEIWLVSKWIDWVIDLLPTSINNLTAEFDKPVRVIGRKDFGEMDQKSALSVPLDDRMDHTKPVSVDASLEADRLDNVLKDYEYYYPVMDNMCLGNRTQCRVFTPGGLLVSADGSHLTREGAIEIGQRLRSMLNELRN